MLSVQDIAAVKTAIEICNNPELKRDILCATADINEGNHQYGSKEKWNEQIEKKGTIILRKLELPKKLQEKVMGLVLPVGMKMLTWAEYHERTLGFSREYSIIFLNSSFFTQQGIIDNKKAAEELMSDKNLSIVQKFKLACIYCFTDHISALHRQMTKEDKDNFCNIWITQPELVRFWSYYLMGEVDKIKGEKTVDQYRLEKAVESGSKAAVEYCLMKTNLNRKKDAVVDASVEAVRFRVKGGPYGRTDWVVFLKQKYRGSEKPWVPSDYYMDILCFLLSKMREDQQIDFLKKDIEGVKYKRENFVDHRRSRVLEYFLNWPYQNYFMETAGLMWEFLPERSYAVLLLKICDKIEPEKEENLKLGEEKSYDYRGLLEEFWHQSPERYKSYVLSNQEVIYRTNRKFKTKTGVGLVIKLLTLNKFTCEDEQNIRMILASAAYKEIENIISSIECRNFCIGLTKEEKWEILDRFVLICLPSKEATDKFKRELTFTKEVKRICIDFVKNEKWNAAESFINWSNLPEEEVVKFKRELTCTKEVKRICIDFVRNDKWNAAESLFKWSTLSEEEIKQLKREMIYSEDGRDACVDLISPDKKVKAVDNFIRWSFSSEEEVKTFRKELVFSHEGVCGCVDFVRRDQLELVNEFINFCLLSEGEVRELKKKVAYRRGSSVCGKLISASEGEEIYDNRGDVIRRRIKFKGGKWEEVEKFLTWCFSFEEEISEFKKNRLLKAFGKEIHFNLIKSNQWKEAENFFAWLGLSAEEIQELKKETLFHYDAASEMFSELMYSKEGDEEFADYGSKQEAIELLLRWYLTDKETILEFKDNFKRQYRGEATDKRRAMFENFDLMIEQRLKDLDEEQRGVKRKSETFSPIKKPCNLKLENGGAE